MDTTEPKTKVPQILITIAAFVVVVAGMGAAKAILEKNAAENAFFKEVYDSQKEFAAIAVPFWAGAQASNAALGKAYADQVKMAK